MHLPMFVFEVTGAAKARLTEELTGRHRKDSFSMYFVMAVSMIVIEVGPVKLIDS